MDDCLQYAACGFFTLDEQGLIGEANPAFLEMVGFLPEELAGRHVESLLTVASKMLFHSLFFPKLRADGQVDELYLTLRRKDGADIPVLLTGSRTGRDRKGPIGCMTARMTKRDQYERELRAIEQKLESAYRRETETRKLFETTVLSIQEGIVVTDREARILLINDLAAEYGGCPAELVRGVDFYEVFHFESSASHPLPRGFIRRYFSKGETRALLDDLVLIARDGTRRHIMGTAAPLRSPDQSLDGVVASFRDITLEYLQEREIGGFLNVNMDMLCVLTADGTIHRVNRKFTEVLGYTGQELEGRSFLSLVHPDDIERTRTDIRRGAAVRITNRCRRRDGSYRYIEWERQPGTGDFFYSSGRDVTNGKNQEEHLLALAVHDQLTGLYNRHYLDVWLAQAERKTGPMTLAILDLDHFKRVNDTWGHPVGDDQLKWTAHALRQAVRSSDLLVRFGGEEFVIVLPQTALPGAAAALEHARAAVERNIHPVTGRQTVSIGAAERRAGEAFSAWYERADTALYRAKQEGRNRVCCAPPV